MPLWSSKEEGAPYRGLRCAGGTWERTCEPPTFPLSFRYVLSYLRSNQFRIFNWPTRYLLLRGFSFPCLLISLTVSGKNFDHFLCRSLSMKNWMVRYQNVRLIKLQRKLKLIICYFCIVERGIAVWSVLRRRREKKMAKRKRFSGRRWCRSAFPNQVLLVWHFGDQPPNSCYKGGAGILVRRPDIWYRREMTGY